jgi:hypothetical protein
MAKNNPENYNFVNMPDLKCSFFLVDGKKNKETDDDLNLLIRLEEGRMKGIIVEVSKFNLTEDSNKLTFNYDIVYNPYRKVPSMKTLETFVRKTVGRVVTTALSTAAQILSEGFDENRVADPKVATIK